MSEETQDHNDGTWSGLKKTIIGLITTVVLGAGGVITNKLIGEEDNKETPQQVAPVININNTQTQQQSAGGTKTIIVKETNSAPAKKEAPTPSTREENQHR